MNNDLIFISIASYRDPELVPTIRDCINKAKYPKNLRFGLCWQRSEDESLEEFTDVSYIKYLDIDWKLSKGACWARHNIQKNLYAHETYYLQLDSHHRFLENWDEELLNLLGRAKQHSTKPIIGTYGTTYWSFKNEELKNEPYRINSFETFTNDGDIIFKPVFIDNHKDLKVDLIPARFLSGHFIFTDGIFTQECMYDPMYYFRGEEIVLSARAFTKGYDFYHPTKTIIWHEYIRKSQHKHWLDHKKDNGFEIEGEARSALSKKRQRQLFGMDVSTTDFTKYGLGTIRSLHDYEKYCGLDFKNKRVHKYATNIRGDSPDAFHMSENEWNDGMLLTFPYNISWPEDRIPSNVEFDFWFFGFEDKDGKLLYRKDFSSEDQYYNQFFTKQNNKFTTTCYSEKQPDQCVIIPHIKDNGWAEKIIIPLN